MRIVVVSAWEPWRTSDGAALILHEQLKRLGPRHEITVLAAGAPSERAPVPASAYDAMPGVDLRWYGTDRGRLGDAVRRLSWARRAHEPMHVAWVQRPALVADLAAEVERGVDLVHLHGWGTASVHLNDVPSVHTPIDPWAGNRRNRRLSPLRRWTDIGEATRVRRHERAHYPRHQAVIVVTDADAALMRSEASAEGARDRPAIVVVPNGVDAGPAPAPPPEQPTLGFHGAFESRANVDAARVLVNDVLPAVRQQLPIARAVIVGRNPPHSIRSLAGSHVEVRADVPDVRVELDQINVHVDWMTSGRGVKNKVLEAMAAGRPVVANDRGASGVGGGDGVIITPDLETAVDRIVDLLRHREQATAIGAAGRARVERDFTWDANAVSLEQIWQAAVDRSRA